MAITDTQKVSLFQILEVPLFATVGLLHGESNLNQQPFTSINSDFQAKAAIEAHLSDLAANFTGLETDLKTYLDKWDALGSQVYTLDDGGDGVSYSPENERIELRRRVMVIVPYYRAHDEMSRAGSVNINVSIGR